MRYGRGAYPNDSFNGIGRAKSRARCLLRRNPHSHQLAFDAYIYGNTKAGPEDAYKFALGQTIIHPGGYPIKITRPLDFMAVTDHAEYAGVIPQANDPTSSISKLPIAEQLKVRGKEDMQRVYLLLGNSMIKNEPIKELVSPEVAGSIWKQVVAIADKYYQPGNSRPLRPMSGVRHPTIATCTATSSSKTPRRYRNSLFIAGFGSSGRSLEMDGHPAPGRQRGAGHLA